MHCLSCLWDRANSPVVTRKIQQKVPLQERSRGLGEEGAKVGGGQGGRGKGGFK